MAKGAREQVILECTESKKLGKPVSRYHTIRNKRTEAAKQGGGKLELMKYNPYLKRHTLHREVKK